MFQLSPSKSGTAPEGTEPHLVFRILLPVSLEGQRGPSSGTFTQRYNSLMYWLKWQPTPGFLPGESHGQRGLVGCSLWGCKESDTTKQLAHKQAQQWRQTFVSPSSLQVSRLPHSRVSLRVTRLILPLKGHRTLRLHFKLVHGCVYTFHCPRQALRLSQTSVGKGNTLLPSRWGERCENRMKGSNRPGTGKLFLQRVSLGSAANTGSCTYSSESVVVKAPQTVSKRMSVAMFQ